MNKFHPHIHQLHPPLPAKAKATEAKQTDTSFRDVLDEAAQIKVSKHAKERLQQRNIKIDDQQWDAISSKMTEAKKKGITDSLVITDEATLVVSTKNHTVVTAMSRNEASSKIFTNINGTILMD
ncbi:flagellar protein [Halobacillus litoralis]|uniref:TIGR02530 family flagellar biosynthesis protein n=1 Tax=Halobacillus litoralis TaxID=45668 RepID=UPI001CD63806|nr:TIGR02530 family flagellar biosynthesis protein [Halobacillus litoralis]MCA0969136.1 flagellar protein [Halobacillus litoralis]